MALRTGLDGLTFQPVVKFDEEVEAYLQDAFGPERFKSIAAALCTPPAATCLRVNTGRATPQEVIQQLLQTPALAAAGVTPHVHPAVPMAVILPHGAPPGGPVPWAACAGKRVVVSRKAGESLLRGAAVYAPGVLAATSGISRGDLVAVGVAVERPGSSAMPVTRGTTLPLLDLEAPLLQEEHAEAGAGAGAGAEAGEAGEVSAAGGGGKRSSNRAARIKEATDCWGRYVGLGRACMSRNEMFHAQQGTAVALEHPVFLALPCSGLLPPGTAMLQNLPSIVAALTLAPRPGAAVLDMCAAPGGKATLLAQLMGGVGRVVALDRTHAKACEVQALARDQGASCVEAYAADATKLLPGASSSSSGGRGEEEEEREREREERCGATGDAGAGASAGASTGASAAAAHELLHWQRQQAVQQAGEKAAKREAARVASMARRGLAPPAPPATTPAAHASAAPPLAPCPLFQPESWDYILCDAPCSAMGLRPRLLQPATIRLLHSTAAYQRRLLDQAVRLLKPGGTLVYSTCTINPGENEGNVRYVLDRYDFMQLVHHGAPEVGGPGLVMPGTEQAASSRDAPPPVRHLRGWAPRPWQQAGEACEEGGRAGAGYKECWLTAEEAALVQRFYPDGPADTIGFFIAKFEKTRAAGPPVDTS